MLQQISQVICHSCQLHRQEEELRSNESDGDDTDDEDSDDGEGVARPEDKENLSPNRSDRSISGKASDKPEAEDSHRRRGRKRKRQAETSVGVARDVAAARRLRIRQYYNGATHSSASAVQLFAMAMQVATRALACFGLFVRFQYIYIYMRLIANRCMPSNLQALNVRCSQLRESHD